MAIKSLFERMWTKENIQYVRAVLDKLDNDPHKPDILQLIDHQDANIWITMGYLAKITKPKRYLEVGVRRGFSLAIVAARQKDAALTGIDLWMPNYGNTSNPGPEFVREQIALTGFKGQLELLSGNSHQILPALVDKFDLILIDGDHTTDGVAQDVAAALRLLLPGGYLVIDDLHDPAVLAGWQQVMDQLPMVHFVEGRVGIAIR